MVVTVFTPIGLSPHVCCKLHCLSCCWSNNCRAYITTDSTVTGRSIPRAVFTVRRRWVLTDGVRYQVTAHSVTS